MKNLIIAATVSAGLSSTAFAADLENDVIDQVFGWGGFYAGFELGYGRGDATLNEGPGPGAFGNLPIDVEPKGAIYGVTGGYNWQFDNSIVLGVEAAYSRTNIDDSGVVGLANVEGSIEDLITVGPKLGYAFDRALIYVEGGYANASIEAYATAPAGTFDPSSERTDGYYFGAGIDYAITENIVFGIEYNRVELSDVTLSGQITGFGPLDINIEDGEIDIFRARLLYKF